VTQASMAAVELEEEKMTWQDRFVYGWDAVKEIIGRVWIYVILGIAVGAASTDLFRKASWHRSWAKAPGGLCPCLC